MKIALMGTGLLGYAMAERLLAQNFKVVVYNRTIAKAQGLKDKGAIVVSKPEDAFKSAQCILLVLSDADAIRQVLFSGSEDLLENKTIIQMGTIAPNQSIEIQKKVFELGGEYLECPVLGSRKEALAGNLILMMGTTSQKFSQWNEFLKVFGQTIVYAGEVGKASALKLALNQLIISHAVGFSLSLAMVLNNDIKVDTFMEVLRNSSLYAPMIEKKLARWLKQDYTDPNFPLKHLLKDIDLISDEAVDKNINAKTLEVIREIMLQAIEKGLGDKDYSVIYKSINEKSQ